MRITVDIPEDLLKQVQRMTRASTRREALGIALEDYVRRQRRGRLIAAAGLLDIDLDVRALREAGKERLGG